ncbi:MAG: hypothetical protein EP330_28825 [Deltaproteobacteria bacterium]|nr:MAG: hypothetical protein EP330_28825 [Deltaproteobacteria bacterium]
MIGLWLAALAFAAPEENTFALVATGFEWATPDLRFEVGEDLPVGAVLSWPITPVSVSLCRLRDCRQHLVLEPYVEPQLRAGSGDTRFLAGSQLMWMPSRRGLAVLMDGAGVHESQEWGWAAGGGLAWTGGANRGIRGRIALRGRYVQGPSGWRSDLSLDMGFPMAGKGWAALFRGDSVDDARVCDPDDPSWPSPERRCRPVDECGDMCGLVPDGCGGMLDCGDCRDYRPPACDPVGCMPGMCGIMSDGCGGTQFCGPCDEELPGCDPYGCSPGMCGEVSDGCGGTMFCGMCEEELLPICTPISCMPGMCGEQPDDCGGTMWCGPCEEEILLPGCRPHSCEPGMCGPMPDGCGGTLDCGVCEEPTCDPIGCMPGTCGVQPDGCGGQLDCGPCGP